MKIDPLFEVDLLLVSVMVHGQPPVRGADVESRCDEDIR
jgi:hypothetical protein